PDGKIIFDLGKDGSFCTTLTTGTVMKLGPDGKTLTVDDGKSTATYKKVGNSLVFQQSDADVVIDNTDTTNMKTLLGSIKDAFSGKPVIHTSPTGTSIQGKDGRLMAILNDGTAVLSIDQHSL